MNSESVFFAIDIYCAEYCLCSFCIYFIFHSSSLIFSADLFSRYLKLPIHEDMCPAHIVFFNSSLLYSPALSPGTHLHTDREAQKAAEKTVRVILILIHFNGVFCEKYLKMKFCWLVWPKHNDVKKLKKKY